MSNSVSSIVIDEDGKRSFVHNPDRGEYGDTVGADIRAFERRMEQGGTAKTYLQSVSLRTKGNRITPELIMPDSGFIMVYDFQSTRMGAVSADVYDGAEPESIVEPEIAIAELEADEPRMVDPSGTHAERVHRVGKAENKTIIDWITQHNTVYGPKRLLAGWDNHGNPVSMDTKEQRDSQKEEAAVYMARVRATVIPDIEIDEPVASSESSVTDLGDAEFEHRDNDWNEGRGV